MGKLANEAYQRWVAESQGAMKAQADEIGVTRSIIQAKDNSIKNLGRRQQQLHTALEGAERENAKHKEENIFVMSEAHKSINARDVIINREVEKGKAKRVTS